MTSAFDVIVIGGGTAGLVTASGCARLGRRVAIIDRQELGGDCLWTGCVPTKALVASARLAQQMRDAAEFGLAAVAPHISPASVMQSMREVQRITAKHDDPEKFRRLGIEVIQAAARFVSRTEVEIDGRRLTAKDIVIATGSRTAVPPIEGLADAGFVDHASFLRRDTFPDSVVIIGGGAIGVEFAQLLARFGSDVAIVEAAETILPHEDHDTISAVSETLEQEGVEIHAGHSVKAVRTEGGRKIVTIENPAGGRRDLDAAEIFVASGRRGNTEELGLEAIGVRTERSYVAVDRWLQTSVPRIWACGDVHGGPQFTHVAAYEGVKLVRNMLFPGRSAVDYRNVPWCIFTDPEVARVGLTEREAVAKFGEGRVKTYCIEMTEVDRAVIERADRGFVKLVSDRRGQILGAHVVAANASALIGELVLARSRGVSIGELAQLVTPYPSMADAIRKAAAMHYQRVGEGWIGRIARKIAAWSQ